MVVVSERKIEMDLFWADAPKGIKKQEPFRKLHTCVMFVNPLSLPLVYVMIIQYRKILPL